MPILVLAFTLPGTAFAATFDCPAGDVPCLISAINMANGTVAADTINLAAGTYTLTAVDDGPDGFNGLPSITSTVTIRGAGATATVIERGPFQSFRIIHVGVAGDLTLDGLTIQGGDAVFGGGLLNNGGAAKISNCVFSRNSAYYGGGIHVLNGRVVIANSVLTGNASIFGQGAGLGTGFAVPAIVPGGVALIADSIISDNQGSGVLDGGGDVTIENSTVARNSGGGLENFGRMAVTGTAIFDNATSTAGGGVHNEGGTLDILNSTIGRNHAGSIGGGVYVLEGSVTLTNSTVSGNIAESLGGGIFLEGGAPTRRVQLQNTILAGNPNGDCVSSGLVTSLGNNLIGGGVGCPLLPSDLTGDAGLHSFMDDGTPGNGHFPLVPGSQAIDAGNPAACLPTDQLGQSRFDGDDNGSVICDIGAIEFRGPPPPGEVIVNDLVTLNSVTTSLDPDSGFPFGTFTITARFTNTSTTPIAAPVFVVTTLSGHNVLVNSDGPPHFGSGSRLTPDVGSDGVLSPGEQFTVEFEIGLVVSRAPFTFLVDLLGVPQP